MKQMHKLVKHLTDSNDMNDFLNHKQKPDEVTQSTAILVALFGLLRALKHQYAN